MQTLLVRMERKKDDLCWRVDATSYPLFKKHVMKYFTLNEMFQEKAPYTVMYADIDDKSFCTLSYLFAAFKIRKNIVITKIIHPDKLFPTWNDILTIRVCIKIFNTNRILLFHLKMKTKRELNQDIKSIG